MVNTKQMETSLLTEHLRYTPLALIDDIINTVNELLARAIDAAEAGLLSTDARNLGFGARAAAANQIPETDDDGKEVFPEARREIEEGVHKLETLLEAATDKNFDKLEIYVLRSVLAVPEELVGWVRLGHYENLTLPSPNTSTPTPETLLALRRKLQETRKLHTALLVEKARNDALIAQLRALLSPPATTCPKSESISPTPDQLGAQPPSATSDSNANNAGALSFLTHAPAAKTLGIPPLPPSSSDTSTTAPAALQTHTSFALSQLPALRSLLSSLRPKLATLPTLPSDADGGSGSLAASKAAERRGYVEAQTRRILERRGVDVREGVGALEGGGGRRGGDEVRALEGVVGAFGAEEGEGERMDVDVED